MSSLIEDNSFISAFNLLWYVVVVSIHKENLASHNYENTESGEVFLYFKIIQNILLWYYTKIQQVVVSLKLVVVFNHKPYQWIFYILWSMNFALMCGFMH